GVVAAMGGVGVAEVEAGRGRGVDAVPAVTLDDIGRLEGAGRATEDPAALEPPSRTRRLFSRIGVAMRRALAPSSRTTPSPVRSVMRLRVMTGKARLLET